MTCSWDVEGAAREGPHTTAVTAPKHGLCGKVQESLLQCYVVELPVVIDQRDYTAATSAT
jgi:hypothetical protein